MIRIQGTSASPGKVMGPAHLLARRSLTAARSTVENPHLEIQKLEAALAKTEADLSAIARITREGVGDKEAGIFEAQILILQDPDLLQRTKNLVLQENMNVAYAWQESIRYYAEILKRMENEYLAARVTDVEDVGQRVLARLLDQAEESPDLAAPAVIVADDLTPADTITLDRELILAFCTRGGGPTSHAAILSKALGIPCVVALGDSILQVKEGQLLLVDAEIGEVILEPDQAAINKFEVEDLEARSRDQEAENLAALPAETLDRRRVEVVANIGSAQDAEEAIRLGAEGVGLLRTEFLFLDRSSAPSRTEQVSVYTKIFQIIGRVKPIVVRTLDIGGDKPVQYLPVNPEQNPFLGIRGIRLSLRNPGLFSEQLSALLIAGHGYDLRIMFPMVSTVEEVLKAQEILEACKVQLTGEGIPHIEKPQVGIMVEVPSTAILAGQFAKHVDFFSIGTNDLTQYTLAAERTSGEVAALNDPLNPAVLTLIQQVVMAAHEQGKWVGLCGELAGDILATPLLIGMGLDELSAPPRLLPRLKQKIRSLNAQRCAGIVENILHLSTTQEVREFLRRSR